MPLMGYNGPGQGTGMAPMNSNIPMNQNIPMNGMGAQGGYSALRPAPVVPMVPGKMFANEEEIKPNEVPMDGSIALFMHRDLGYILAKAWNSGGTIDTVRYVPEKPPAQQAQPQTDAAFQNAVFERLDKIERAIKQRPKHNSRPQAKKEET